MKSRFSHPVYEILITFLLVGHLFWNLSLVIHLADLLKIIPSVIMLGVFVLLFLRSQYLAYWIKLWSLYLIVSGGISITTKLLLAFSRSAYPEGIESKIMIVLTGILLWWIASRQVVNIDVEEK